MKSVKLIVLLIALLGTVASVFNILYDGSLNGFHTLWPSLVLFSVVFIIDKKTVTAKPAHQ